MATSTTNVVLQHDAAKNCQKANNTNKHWSTTEFGGTGDLTQVFKTEDGYVITVIHTFLGEVDSFVGTNKYSHATTAKATAKVWLNRGSEDPDLCRRQCLCRSLQGHQHH